MEKAFDRVHHADLFRTLLDCGVTTRTVLTLRELSSGLRARVKLWPGAESRDFDLQRGVRQGDPLSTLLFNLVMRDVLDEVETLWKRRGYGSDVGTEWRQHRLTHVAFADDVTLIASSWLTLKRMIVHLKDALGKRGLTLHPSKCQAQTNLPDWNRRGNVTLQPGLTVEVLPEGSPLRVLGTALALQEPTQIEVPSRIAASWRSFWSLKSLLLNRRTSIKSRLRLFDSTVSSCVLWCSQSWALRAEEARLLRTTRRAMLRRIVGSGRRPDEDYIDWLQRATHKAEQLASDAGLVNWVHSHLLSKWHWAGHVAQRPAETWISRTASWRDSDWQSFVAESRMARPQRPSRRRWTKWEDHLRRYCYQAGLGPWKILAKDRIAWAAEANHFAACYF